MRIFKWKKKWYCKRIWRNNLIFEGVYLNGKRNGLGKEYIPDKLKFEGEFLNEERNGKGIEYIHDIGSFFQNDNDDDNNYIIGIGSMPENKENDNINDKILEDE